MKYSKLVSTMFKILKESDNTEYNKLSLQYEQLNYEITEDYWSVGFSIDFDNIEINEMFKSNINAYAAVLFEVYFENDTLLGDICIFIKQGYLYFIEGYNYGDYDWPESDEELYIIIHES